MNIQIRTGGVLYSTPVECLFSITPRSYKRVEEEEEEKEVRRRRNRRRFNVGPELNINDQPT
jgi:hypothetical protein